jgi:virulence factor Mce-like protein
VKPRRRGTGALTGSPVLIGAVTTLIVIVAVFLAYNANNGLPFVPTYDLNARVPDASGLIKGDNVRVGGARVGVVSKITPLSEADGASGAVLHLKLDKSVQPLPVDSKLLVRPQSPLGLKYLEITPGRSTRGFPTGDTIPLAASTPRPVEIDQVFDMFDKPTRAASRVNLDQFGDALAGRGQSLNQALGRLEPLVTRLTPVMRNLMDNRTHLDRFFPSLEQAAHEVAPVAAQQGELFVALDTTFTALSSVRGSIQQSISGGPPALETATRELPAQAGFVRDSTELFRRFRPGFRSLAHASIDLAPAFRAGAPALRRSPKLNGQLDTTLASLQTFAGDPRVVPGLARLIRTANLLEPLVAFATPAQTTCNYGGLFFQNLESALSESDQVGSFLRFGILALPQVPGSEAGPAASPANGPPPPPGTPARIRSLEDDSFLHSNPYPNTAAPGQTFECEAGNEGYRPGRQAIGNLPGSEGTFSEKTGNWRQAK